MSYILLLFYRGEQTIYYYHFHIHDRSFILKILYTLRLSGEEGKLYEGWQRNTFTLVHKLSSNKVNGQFILR